jgi:hypothetical protein
MEIKMKKNIFLLITLLTVGQTFSIQKGLKVLIGKVHNGGSIVEKKDGGFEPSDFTSKRTLEGHYNVKFTESPFTSPPAIFVSVARTTKNEGESARMPFIYDVTKTGFGVEFFNKAEQGSTHDAPFNFLAIGN